MPHMNLSDTFETASALELNTYLSSLFLHTVINNNSKTRYLLFKQDKKNPLEEFRRTKYAHKI